MGGIFSSPSPPPPDPAPPPAPDPEDESRKRRLENLERQRRGRAGLITTSARGLLDEETKTGADAAARPLKTKLGE